ncbi:crotonase/enoyl-CoA hydratase family protein [Tomitella biformata]|uniref:crotonase/enoyl-CoA hydratase family protein n=1 Tax=Tomitella biformata TaxID=630403 RepID=UPI0004632DBA|nr:crotonase/enoyl-CoA hydratase family protein [Tomitella biformata]
MDLTKTLKQAVASGRAIADNPGMILDLGRAVAGSLFSRSTYAPPAAVEFSREFEHRFGTAAHTSANPADVLRVALDFARYSDWFAMHTDWPHGAPPSTGLTVGDTFTEAVRIMGTPARIDWTVTHYSVSPHGGHSSFALEGTGPMGVVVGLWIAVSAEDSGGSEVSVSGGFLSDALKGPMASMVTGTLQTSTAESVERLVGVVEGASSVAAEIPTATTRPKPAGPRPDPIPHAPSGTVVDAWAPVIVGVGQVVNRPADGDPLADPIALAVRSIREALSNSESDASLLNQRVSVAAVPSTSWVYGGRQAGILADELGIDAAALVQSAPLGGDGPQRLISDAAQAISDGLVDVAIVAGAESFASTSHAQRTSVPFDWERAGGEQARVIGSERQGNNAAEDAVGLLAPVYMYALMETALRGKLGATVAAHTASISALWSRFSEVARGNPHAWLPRHFSAEEIATPTANNRPLSSPYPKLMTANLTVDLGAGLVLCSAAAAQAAGVPPEQWVFVHAGAHADEEWFVSERSDLASAPAIGAAGRAALAHTGIGIGQVSHVDLYSCFPFAVQAAAAELGLSLDRQLTQTGGLTFAGAPLNNYSTHGVAALVESLRRDPGSYGLATALGWYATKHAIGVYSTTPPRRRFQQIDAGLRMNRPRPRQALAGYSGDATIESFTVAYDAAGTPDALIVSALTADGARALARTTDPELVRRGVDEDLLGAPITLGESMRIGPAGSSAAARALVDATPAGQEPLTVEWDGPLCVITLNRPEVRNAVDLALALAIEKAIDSFEADPQGRVAILRGAGGDFCTGMDLKAAAAGQFPLTAGRGLLGLTARPPAKPIIAAVDGYALAGGCELALACDLIVAAEDASFGLPEAKRGLVAAAGGVLRLAQRLPRAVALELAYTGEPMSASRLHALGLINRVAPPGQTLDAARELALQIAGNAPLSIALSKEIVDSHADWTPGEAFERQGEIASAASYSDDAAEGVRAFNERRAPEWTGR